MQISITNDIKPITCLKKNITRLYRQVHDTGRPIVLTGNGKATAVLIGAKEYQKMTDALEYLRKKTHGYVN